MNKRTNAPVLNATEAEEILQEVFLECYVDTNSIPVEQMELYSNYRTERLSLQRYVSIVLMVAFCLLPLWFVSPRFSVSAPVIGERGLPVYTVEVKNFLPIFSVTAVMDNYSMPVYQREKKVFTIEPTKNGVMDVTVTLFSQQWYTRHVVVDSFDDKVPVYVGNSYDVRTDTLYVYVKDEESGVDYEKSYVEDGVGNVINVDGWNENEGYVEVKTIPEKGILHIYDTQGNELLINISRN